MIEERSNVLMMVMVMVGGKVLKERDKGQGRSNR